MDDVYTSPDVFHFDYNRPSFEDLEKDNGFHFWMCSCLMKLLGYKNVSDVANLKPVQRAITTYSSRGIPIQENFYFTVSNIKSTRFACYLVAMNSDPKNNRLQQLRHILQLLPFSSAHMFRMMKLLTAF